MSVTGDTAAITGDGRSKSLLVHAASYVLWPAILGACIYGVGRGIETGHAAIHFNVTYLCLALGLVALERVLPHERQWLANDGQVGTDLAHTLLNKGFAQVLVVVGVAVGIAEAAATEGREHVAEPLAAGLADPARTGDRRGGSLHRAPRGP